MNMRCKNGDLALVIRDNKGCEANVGRLVEVRGPVVPTRYGEDVTWQIAQVEQNGPWFIRESDGTVTAEILTWDSRVVHPDSWLKPIRPGKEDEDEALWRTLHAPKHESQAVGQVEAVHEEAAQEGLPSKLVTNAAHAALTHHPKAPTPSAQVLSRTVEHWFA